MKTIRLLKDVIGGDGGPLKEGSFYSLNDASANHWLKRGLAVEEDQPAEDATSESESAPRRRKQKGIENGNVR